jgi:hypothetical protein
MRSMASNNPSSNRVGKFRQKTTVIQYYSTILRLLCKVGYRRQTLFLAIHHLAGQFPEPHRDRIQQLAAFYARAVVDEEWTLMRKGQTSPNAAALTKQLTESVDSFEPSTSAEQGLYTQVLERTHSLNQNRDDRLLDVREGCLRSYGPYWCP